MYCTVARNYCNTKGIYCYCTCLHNWNFQRRQTTADVIIRPAVQYTNRHKAKNKFYSTFSHNLMPSGTCWCLWVLLLRHISTMYQDVTITVALTSVLSTHKYDTSAFTNLPLS